MKKIHAGWLAALMLVLGSAQAGIEHAHASDPEAYTFNGQDNLDVPYVPTPENVVEEMLDMAAVTGGDLVYDLGCGDGRIVIAAAKERGARGIGVDLDPQRIRESRENAREAQVTDRVRFFQQDLFEVDLSEATVVTLYLLPSVNLELRSKLFQELRPGTRVVSHDFDMGEWAADRTAEVEGSMVYFWVVPANVSGTWEWTMPARAGGASCVLQMDQEYQNATGTLRSGSAEMPLRNIDISGDAVSFIVDQQVNGKTIPMRYEGRVNGSTIEGGIRAQDGSMTDGLAWKAWRDPGTETPLDGQPAAVGM